MYTGAATQPTKPRPTGRLLALTLAAALLAGAASESAWARRGGHRHHGPRVAIGVFLAAPAYRYFPAPVYLPPAIVAPAPPVYYIERRDAQPESVQSATDWRYYCADSKAYYPYVTECATAWQRLAAEPRPSRE